MEDMIINIDGVDYKISEMYDRIINIEFSSGVSSNYLNVRFRDDNGDVQRHAELLSSEEVNQEFVLSMLTMFKIVNDKNRVA